jgi:predicted deacetylase
LRGVADADGRDLFLHALDQFARRRFVHVQPRQAEHFCPPMPKAERTMPAAARSRSACSVTMHGFLPPISAMQGAGTARCHLLQQLHAHADRTGEGDAGGERMAHQRIADVAPEPET